MHIAIITGGETGEREISINSAQYIAESIDFAITETFIFPEDKDTFLSTVNKFDLVIPMIHGEGGEDGTLQKMLHEAKLPFLFSDVMTHEVAIDKKRTKEVVEKLGILSPQEINTFPLFAKPRFGGSSVASKLCSSSEDLQELIKTNPELEFITEEPIKGREFTVGIIEYQQKTFALPVIEIIPPGEFFDFESKYDTQKLAQEICPANIDAVLTTELQNQALKVHTFLQARHISRSDFIVTPDNKIYFLEVNTIPGMTATSLIPKMLKTVGISLANLLKDWCGL